MNEQYSLDIIYKYTESLIKSQEEHISRLDNKLNTLIGFSGLLIRLALDLPELPSICHVSRITACAFAGITLVISCWGLMHKPHEDITKPQRVNNLYSNLDNPEFEHKKYITTAYIELEKEYSAVENKKQTTADIAIKTFAISSLALAVGVIFS